MVFAKRVFLIAGIYGLLVLLPQYVLLERTGRDFPPPITHHEYYYGFIGLGIVWQIAFLILSKDPIRYRPMMIPAILEKISFGIPVVALFMLNRVSGAMLGAAAVDLLLGSLFVVAYLGTPSS